MESRLDPCGPVTLGCRAQSIQIGSEDVSSSETGDWMELHGAGGEKGEMRCRKMSLWAVQATLNTRGRPVEGSLQLLVFPSHHLRPYISSAFSTL